MSQNNTEAFTITFKENWLKRNYILEQPNEVQCKVISEPRRIWWKVLLQYLTFGIYKAPYEYDLELIKQDETAR